MKVMFLRHGETAGNLEKRYVGRTDEPLTEEAREKLRTLLENGELPELTDDAVIYVSPMIRCVEMAEILFPDREKIAVSELSECDFGRFEYKNYRELDGDVDYQRFIDSGGMDGFPDGEPVKGFRSRCTRAFRQIAEQNREKDMLVFVVHGGTIMSLLAEFARPKQDYFYWQVKNGSGYLAEAAYEKDGRGTDWILTDVTAILNG